MHAPPPPSFAIVPTISCIERRQVTLSVRDAGDKLPLPRSDSRALPLAAFIPATAALARRLYR